MFARLQRLLSPLLAVPHVTVAIGLAFLVSPSGWLVRLVSPWATGFDRPPDVAIVQDPAGLSLIAALVVKEIPFLFVMALAALGQIDAQRTRPVARALGYGQITGWLKTVFPRVYAQIRLPVFAVLAYAISVVDVALVMAPTTPPPLAVQLVRWFNDPDIGLRFVASAGAIGQLLLAATAIGLWVAGERLVAWLGRCWVRAGWRGRHDAIVRHATAWLLGTAFGAAALSLVGMAVWSVTGRWRYPDAVPSSLALAKWVRHAGDIGSSVTTTATVGVTAALVAMVLTIGCLEGEARFGRRVTRRALWLIYLPLLVPQIAFLFGAQVLLVVLGLDGSWPALVWAHLVFVLPYVFLSLADPYRAWDERYARSAACLGATPARVLVAVKLPMLARPIFVAAAVGFAVSVGQYLPTLFAGAGRFATLTTEAVSLAAGGDRRLIGIYALLQMALPFAAFVLATALPAWLFRDRRAMKVTA